MATANHMSVAEWRKHWTVVLSAASGLALGTVYVYSIGVMMAPIERELGWSRSEISSGPTISAVLAVLFSPFVGMAIDRFGPRRIGIAGTVLVCLAIASLAGTTHSIWYWWAAWTFIGFATLLAKPTVWAAGVSGLFDASRGLALSITFCGSGIGSAIIPLMTFYLIEHFGWRGAYVGLAAIWGAIAMPLVYFFFIDANDRLRRPTDARAKPAVLPGLTARQGFESSPFFKLAAAAFALSVAATACITNMVPILTFTGLQREAAAAVAGLVGISTIIGRLSGGFLLDRYRANKIAAVCALLPTASCLLLLAFPGSLTASSIAVLILGTAFGAEYDSVAYLVSRIFGLRSFGALFGTIIGLLSFAAGIGPLCANMIYDKTGSYFPVLWGFIPFSLLSSVLFLEVDSDPLFDPHPGGSAA